MHLRSVELREIRLPLLRPFRISSGVVAERRISLLRLEHADGPHMWAECVAGEAPNYSPETVETAWHALTAWFIPRALAGPLPEPAQAGALLTHSIRGHRMARAAIEMGIWALSAALDGVPLAQRLGGTRTTIDVGISLGIRETPESLAADASAAKAAGYRRIKLKIAPGADIAFVAAVRDRLGPDFALTVDANAAYRPQDSPTLQALDDYDLLMIEQPFDPGDLVRHAALQRAIRTSVCLDESVTSVARASDMITLGSGRIVNIKAGRVGGITEATAIHDLCLANDIPVWCGGMLESGIGRAYNVALASLPGFTLPGDVSPSARYWERDVVTPEWVMTDDGRMRVPLDRPGLGVDVDEDRIDDLTVRMEKLVAS